jgi:uncharacterized membrane protein (UPF0127 family)
LKQAMEANPNVKWDHLRVGQKIIIPRRKGSRPNPALLPTHAQSKLPTIRLWLGAAEVSAEMALTGIQQETGMMFRTNMDENSGMIFPLPYPQQARFWMANCPLPLTAAYIDPQGQILEIHELHANDTNGVVADASNILRPGNEPGLVCPPSHRAWHRGAHRKGHLQETFRRPNP